MTKPRLDKRRLRAIEDALVNRQSAPGDLETRPARDYTDALEWVEIQLGKRRLPPTAHVPPKTPLEQWIDSRPKEPGQ
jgi:hypothetical protein